MVELKKIQESMFNDELTDKQKISFLNFYIGWSSNSFDIDNKEMIKAYISFKSTSLYNTE